MLSVGEWGAADRRDLGMAGGTNIKNSTISVICGWLFQYV